MVVGMASCPFYWIDAFTNKRLGGNPCAVVLDADRFSTEEMQAIAREINLSETAFVLKSTRADFGARYFTPQEELPFAGHPTVAVAHSLVCAGLIKPGESGVDIRLELPAGVIPVRVSGNAQGSKVTMSQLAPKFLRTYQPEEILPIFGLSTQDLLPGAPIQTVSTGTPILMIPLASHEVLRRVEYRDAALYKRVRVVGDFYYPHFFTLQGATSRGQTFARSLGTPPNGLEDPFTGSSTGCMAAYLWKHRLIKSPAFIAEQGHWMNRPGEAEVEVVGPPDQIETIRLTGNAVSLIEGRLT